MHAIGLDTHLTLHIIHCPGTNKVVLGIQRHFYQWSCEKNAPASVATAVCAVTSGAVTKIAPASVATAVCPLAAAAAALVVVAAAVVGVVVVAFVVVAATAAAAPITCE